MPLMIIAVFAAVILTSCDKPDPDDDTTTNVSTGSTPSDDTNKSNKMWVVNTLTVINPDGEVEYDEKYEYDKKGRKIQITTKHQDTLTINYTADAIYCCMDSDVTEYLVEDGLIVQDKYNTIEYSDGRIHRKFRQPNMVKHEMICNWDENFLVNVVETETWLNDSINGTRIYTSNLKYVPLDNINADCARFFNTFIISETVGLQLSLGCSGFYGEMPCGGVISELEFISYDGRQESAGFSFVGVDANGCPSAFIVKNNKTNKSGSYNVTWRQITVE